jgi:glycosyltransferase involved in cell wall biosynthesis
MKLVSAILPTRDRSAWAWQAVQSFVSQTYSEKEIVIIDDYEQPSFPELGKLGEIPVRFTYRRSGERVIGRKRNQCCEMAGGEIVIHFDSDDWSNPQRMAQQVQLLERSGKAVTGYNSLLFYDERSKAWGRHLADSNYAFGSSLCYRRDWWKDHPFPDHMNIGEDNAFVYAAASVNQLETVSGEAFLVARMHPDNTSAKDIGNCRPIDPREIPGAFPA